MLRGARREALAGLGETWQAPVIRADGAPDAAPLAVLDAVPAWTLVVDAARRLVFANRAYLAFRGRKLTDLAGRPLEEVLLPGMVEGTEALDLVGETVRSGRPGSLTTVHILSAHGE